ncbi:MAG: DsbA family protein [Gammaproteobacteria bacterium]|jgi:putative protein-disulfide isomerase
MTSDDKLLLYIADPMCSWCWGFTPVFDEIKSTFGDRLKVALILGGLRPGTREPMTDTAREEIFHHWREVQKLTGQSFQFDGALADDFVYDTEKPSRAVVTVGELNPEAVMPYFKTVQAAFYREHKDVTRKEVLAALAVPFAVDADRFNAMYDSQTMKDRTQAHFVRTRQLGVRGFPTLILQAGGHYKLITHGYRPFDDLKDDIDQALV